MTIHELLALTGLTANDEIPVWDAEASGEPTKKITAQNFAAAIKTLASLLGTGDVVNDLTRQDTDKPAAQKEAYDLYIRVATNNFDSAVDLSSYTPGQYYNATNDGYIVYATESGGYIGFRVYSGSNSNYFSVTAGAEKEGYIYIRKGMRIDLRFKSAGITFQFYPFA